MLGGPSENRFTYRYALPAGWIARELPEDASADTPEGAFDVRHRQEGDAVIVEGRIILKTGRVPAARYPAFRELAATIDRALARRVRVGPAAGDAR